MKYTSSLDIGKLDRSSTIVIVSPGNFEDMVNYPCLCKDKGIGYIFDPGQSLPMWDVQDLIRSLDGCRILIVNDYEFDLIMHRTGLTEQLLQKAGTLITTLGEGGSQISTAQSEIKIPVVEPRKVEDPTGCGDSYRGGLISGLVRGKNIEESAKMGSVCASFAVECYGTQEYTFTMEEFNKRLNG